MKKFRPSFGLSVFIVVETLRNTVLKVLYKLSPKKGLKGIRMTKFSELS
jgi:hypothetical protein